MINSDIPLVDEKIAHPGDSLKKVVIKYYILDKLIITISLENEWDYVFTEKSIKYYH